VNALRTYVSRDGLSWGRGDLLPKPDTATLDRAIVTGMAAGPDRVVVVGALESDAGNSAISWSAAIP
jgi:hypothetical protein